MRPPPELLLLLLKIRSTEGKGTDKKTAGSTLRAVADAQDQGSQAGGDQYLGTLTEIHLLRGVIVSLDPHNIGEASPQKAVEAERGII